MLQMEMSINIFKITMERDTDKVDHIEERLSGEGDKKINKMSHLDIVKGKKR